MLVLEHFQLWEITENDLLNVYNTNVFGMALLTHSCHNLRQNSGNIINIGGTSQKVLHKVQFSPHQNLQLEV
jgi:NAD(P)-dependent dehydrogenase (short-subunit alcohol dehydrogenase family)